MPGRTSARAAAASTVVCETLGTAAAARRAAVATVLALGTLLIAGVSTAFGGSYTVHVCDPGYGNVDFATYRSASLGMTSTTNCSTDAAGREQGVMTFSNRNVGLLPGMSTASATTIAPLGTTLESVDARYIEGHEGGTGWVSGFQSSTDRFVSNSSWLSGSCSQSSAGCVSAGPSTTHWDLHGATGFRTVAACTAAGGCYTTGTSSYPYTQAYVYAHRLGITLRDDSLPGLTRGRGAAWNWTAWHRGIESIGFDAGDVTGVSRMRVEVFDGSDLRFGWPVDQPFACDYTHLVPCSNHAYDGSVDTRDVADGIHTIRLAASDGAGNWAAVDSPLKVDNHAPGRVTGLSIDGGEGWTSTRTRTLEWSNPDGQVAPVVLARVHVCKDGDCRDTTVATPDPETAQVEPFAGPGDYSVQVYLRDAAGNEDSDTMSDPVHMRFDDVAPAQATPQHRNGWVNRSEAKSYLQHIEAPLASRVPVSGVAGYAITTDGSEPGNDIAVRANADDYSADATLGDLEEGVTRFRARAISGAGVPSAEVGTEDIHVDLAPPEVSLQGAPDPNRWSRTPVSFNVVATEPVERSGMAGPEAADPDDAHGGYIAYAMDDESKRLARGPAQPEDVNTGLRGFEGLASTAIAVAGDGPHTLTYSATDVAGNDSAERSLSFKIDRTPPELVVFEPQEQEDPRLIRVAAADATSGLADGGVIQFRRIRPSLGDWITLRTSRNGQRYTARIDNRELPDGEYQFRATVPDQAGNEATGDRSRAGQPEVIHIDPTHIGPFPTDGDRHLAGAPDEGATVTTHVSASIVRRVSVRSTKRCSKRGRRKRCTSTTVERLVPRALIPFGRRTTVRGTLTTAAGQPLAGREVVVVAELDAEGSDRQAEAGVRTDRSGRFRYVAPPGASRTLDFLYRGDPTYRHSNRTVVIKVPASASINVSRRRVRNGRSVVFSGKLIGEPYPAKGKILDLQAFYRGRWRTFATPRASLSGRWKYAYRFEATRGRVTYRFRARVRPSSDYPYELGYSRSVAVTVSG